MNLVAPLFGFISFILLCSHCQGAVLSSIRRSGLIFLTTVFIVLLVVKTVLMYFLATRLISITAPLVYGTMRENPLTHPAGHPDKSLVLSFRWIWFWAFWDNHFSIDSYLRSKFETWDFYYYCKWSWLQCIIMKWNSLTYNGGTVQYAWASCIPRFWCSHLFFFTKESRKGRAKFFSNSIVNLIINSFRSFSFLSQIMKVSSTYDCQSLSGAVLIVYSSNHSM